jgi:hypothetical protein
VEASLSRVARLLEGRAGTLVCLAVLIALSAAQVLPPWGHWGDQFATNPGDPALIMWQLSVQAHSAGAGHLGDLMQGNIFYDHTGVLAYSDNMLAYLPIFGPALRITGDNPIAAYNALALAGYAASAISVFALAQHLLGARLPALVAGVVFAVAPYHTASLDHVQLIGIAFVPLGLLALMQLCAQPQSWRWAVVLGACVGLAWLSSLYCAMMLAVALPVAFVVWALQRRLHIDVRLVPRIAAAVGVAAVLMAPTLPAYLRAQSTGINTRSIDELITAQLSGFRHLPPSPLWSAFGHGDSALIEQNALFPGLVALVLAAIGVIVVGIVLWRRPPWTDSAPDAVTDQYAERRREWALPLLAVALACLVVMLGPRHSAPLSWPDRLLRAGVPGMADLRDLVRFWLVGLALLGLAAGAGALWLLTRLGPRRGVALVVGLIALCAVEDLYRLPYATVAVSAPQTDVNTMLASLPPGSVVELPIEPIFSFSYALSLAPRQLRSVIDGLPRVEGYSGNIPADSRAAVEVARTLPDPAALLALRRLGVRYLVLHGASAACAGAYGPDELRAVVQALAGQPGVARMLVSGADTVVVLDGASPGLRLADVVAPAAPSPARPVPLCPGP